ncbi:TetR/AcrR family transcriptional regulator [Mycobacterium sp.]|uniref:TetR/AcrR family transcriptional regulator n=1 Tax=Mycobacterium sp. TaxID=1785 RepID=UPI0025E263E2|nr:TetR/AcrR family transcriptional regulator [Mycobacterium sp.]MBW0015135.1 TetR/AcrR family transcriptional regulator [Mycobacterium sp.]
MTTHPPDGRADVTRRHILRAACNQFARRAYHDVGLDDILTEAELTKGAMYFHFRSKRALAVAIIEREIAAGSVAVDELLARGLSGLETLIDYSYLVAVGDIKTDGIRAGLNLLESVGRSEGLQKRLLDHWVKALATVVEQAIAEGDISPQCEPHDVARLMVSLHMGLRQTSNLDEPERFLCDLENCWVLLLNGILEHDRTGYFRQFLRRRSALAIAGGAAGAGSD